MKSVLVPRYTPMRFPQDRHASGSAAQAGQPIGETIHGGSCPSAAKDFWKRHAKLENAITFLKMRKAVPGNADAEQIRKLLKDSGIAILELEGGVEAVAWKDLRAFKKKITARPAGEKKPKLKQAALPENGSESARNSKSRKSLAMGRYLTASDAFEKVREYLAGADGAESAEHALREAGILVETMNAGGVIISMVELRLVERFALRNTDRLLAEKADEKDLIPFATSNSEAGEADRHAMAVLAAQGSTIALEKLYRTYQVIIGSKASAANKRYAAKKENHFMELLEACREALREGCRKYADAVRTGEEPVDPVLQEHVDEKMAGWKSPEEIMEKKLLVERAMKRMGAKSDSA